MATQSCTTIGALRRLTHQRGSVRRLALGACIALLALSASATSSAAPKQIQTGFFDPNASAGGAGLTASWLEPVLAYKRARAAGANVVRIPILWGRVEADGWGRIDDLVAAARANRLTMMFSIYNAPASEGGTANPNPRALAAFTKFAARRYPDVRLWQVWNEPNNQRFLQRPNRVEKYRALVEAVTAAVRPLNVGNLIVAGATSPFGHPEVGDGGATAPLSFMRALLKKSTSFDIWAHHPYTRGGPTAHAARPNDVSIGDLPEMRRVLTRALRAGKVENRAKVRFWVTEFSWDSKPEDPCGVPLTLHGRWVAEAVYRMWRAGVTLVTWTQFRDYPFVRRVNPYQGGLYLWGGPGKFGAAKPALKGFRFPFVAFRRPGGAYVWGRTPRGLAGRVILQRRTSRGWMNIGRVTTNSHGLFQRRLFRALSASTVLRAKRAGGGAASLPFALRVPRSPNPLPQPLGC